MVTGRKLLLADDSVTIQKVIDLTFSDEGIEVTTVGNGEQAISKLEEIEPDIVLADVFMPGRNGYEVCEHIKRDARFSHIPVLLLVGSFEPFDEAEARRVGADDYLTKPFQSIRQLVGKVTSLLSGRDDSGDEATTRDLNMPEGLAKKAEGEVDPSADIYTADTAPLPKELSDKEPAEAAARLAGHESLDDEMIEAHTASELQAPRETLGAGASRPTAPFSAADLEEAGIKLADAPAPHGLQETIRDFQLEEMNQKPLSTEEAEGQAAATAAASAAPPPSSAVSALYMNNAAAADEALLDLGDMETPVSMREADDFILDLQDDAAPAAPQHASHAEEAAQPAPSAYSESAPQFSEEFSPVIEEPSETPASLSERAPEAPGSQEEPLSFLSTTGEENEARDFEPRAVSYPLTESDGASLTEGMLQGEDSALDYEAQPSAETSPRAGQITLDQLSPEAIDAIARRAVELLSEKVVEQVAWEVVPQLAELLIKRKLEEEKTQ